MRTLQIPTAEVFEPLLAPARYKGAWGGRGSGKSRFFAGLLVEDAMRFPGEAGEGIRALCIREIQKSLKQSAKRQIEQTMAEYGIGEADGFKTFSTVIETPGGGVIEFQGMQDHTADTVKSYEGFHRAWVEEAQTLSNKSLTLLRPTIRWEDQSLGLKSELWFSWNPRRKKDPVDHMFRGNDKDEPGWTKPTDSVCVRANWSDNPWFPGVLEEERKDCLNSRADQYDHIWDGGYATVTEGAYFAKDLLVARQQRRICRVSFDPLLRVRVFCDLGGTGAKADALAMWPAQFVDREIRTRDYYEARGQSIGYHLDWLKKHGYGPDRADIYLPHDGETNDRVHDVSFESAFAAAGYDVTVIPNQGKGAARMRIEAARRRLPMVYFDEDTTEAGRQALGWYHEKKDDERDVGLGPEHDWSSHAADAFGLMCVAYETPSGRPQIIEPETEWIV